MIHSQHYKNVYIASCCPDGGIYRYGMDSYGKLKFIDKTPLDRPMYMVNANGRMYVILRAPFADSNDSGVVAFDIDGDGALINKTECISTKGEVACHIAVDGEAVYCANYISGSLIKLPDKLVVHDGKGANKKRQDKAHTHFVGLTPDKKYICAVDLGVDTVFVYNKDMTLRSKAQVPSGHGARHIIFSEDGKYMFCANELVSTVSAFGYNDGELSLIATISLLPESFDSESTAAAIRIKDGRIYVSNRGHDSVSEVSFQNGELELLKTVDCCGKSPRDFDFVDNFMICTNQDSDSVTVFDCNDNFNLIDKLSVPQPLNVVF